MSRAKRRANRLNAQKSTGPKTPEGKARSSQNAANGVFCRNLLLASENPQELEALRHSALQRFAPRDAVEAELVEQYLVFAWRGRRLRKTEMAVYLERQDMLQQRLLEYQARNGLVGTDGMAELAMSAEQILQDLLCDQANILEKLGRYEQRMFNGMLRCMKELRVLQQEEIEDEESEVQNQATDGGDVKVQNEATAADAWPNPKMTEHLQPPLHEMVAPEARELMMQVEENDRRGANIRLLGAMLEQ